MITTHNRKWQFGKNKILGKFYFFKIFRTNSFIYFTPFFDSVHSALILFTIFKQFSIIKLSVERFFFSSSIICKIIWLLNKRVEWKRKKKLEKIMRKLRLLDLNTIEIVCQAKWRGWKWGKNERKSNANRKQT